MPPRRNDTRLNRLPRVLIHQDERLVQNNLTFKKHQAAVLAHRVGMRFRDEVFARKILAVHAQGNGERHSSRATLFNSTVIRSGHGRSCRVTLVLRSVQPFLSWANLHQILSQSEAPKKKLELRLRSFGQWVFCAARGITGAVRGNTERTVKIFSPNLVGNAEEERKGRREKSAFATSIARADKRNAPAGKSGGPSSLAARRHRNRTGNRESAE